jgi:hypothetical protein
MVVSLNHSSHAIWPGGSLQIKQLMSQFEIFVYGMAIVAVVGAVIAFVQTPDEQKSGLPKRSKKQGVGYAPEYSRQEKRRQLFRALAWALPFLVVVNFYWLPWFNQYAEHAHCYKYGSFTGFHIVLYALFVAVPVVLAIALFSFMGPRFIKVLRIGQFPLPGEKVFRPTKYIYGWRSRSLGVLFFVILISLLGMGVWGYFGANELLALTEPKWTFCENS